MDTHSPRRRLKRVTLLGAAAFVVIAASAVAVEWRRLRVAFAVERILSAEPCPACEARREPQQWVVNGRVPPEKMELIFAPCGRSCDARAEAKNVLIEAAEREPEILALYADDERPVRDPADGPRVSDVVTHARLISRAIVLERERGSDPPAPPPPDPEPLPCASAR